MSSSCFYVNDLDSLVSASNNWTRKKIAFTEDLKAQKELLSYLADEIYRVRLTDDVYILLQSIKLYLMKYTIAF